MAHIGFLCPPIPGHLNPVATLGRALAARGHRTTVFQIPEARRAIEAQQLEFQPLGEGASDTHEIAGAVAKLGTLKGLGGVKFSIRCAASLANTICQHGPATIKNSGVDLLVVDQNEPAGATVAQHLELPFVNVLSGLPLNREAKIPPPFVPWGYTGQPITTIFNVAAYAMFDRLIAPINRVLNEHRRRWKLPLVKRPDDTFSELAQLSQLTEDFDFPRGSKPAALHYLGPFRDDGGPPVPFPYERLNPRPLVYASFGTLQNAKEESFRMVAAACADLDVQLVISTGRGCAPEPAQLPGQPLVVDYAPQRDLLKRAAVCITHGGMNTVMDSLSCGVPMVALPVTNDQPAIAARVRHAGAGEVLFPRRLTATRLKAAVQGVLENPAYRGRARQLKLSIERAGGVERAADIVEDVLARAVSGRSISAA
jgi:UDP:flavonoid glycosyltransferase YjiC (YdhE family)